MRTRRSSMRRHPRLCRRVVLLLFLLLVVPFPSCCLGATSATEELFGVAANEDDVDENDVASDPKQQQHQQKAKHASSSSTHLKTSSLKDNKRKNVVWGSGGNSSKTRSSLNNSPSLPFVKTIHHGPPSGFAIKARVYTDGVDKLAHIEQQPNNNNLIIPYYDCGINGETTRGLPIHAAYWRHARSKPSSFTEGSIANKNGGRSGSSTSSSATMDYSREEQQYHPQLLVCLSRARLEVNSGEFLDLDSGDVVLLENVVGGGHKIYPTPSSSDKEHHPSPPEAMTVMILTLPMHYHSFGKEKSCLTGIVDQQQQQIDEEDDDATSINKKNKEEACSLGKQQYLVGPRTQELLQLPTRQLRKLRTWAVSAIGVSLSAIFMSFLYKQTAIWLSIVIGSVCGVVGSTCLFVQTCNHVLDKLELLHSEKLLREASRDDDDEQDGYNNNDDDDELDLMLSQDEDDISMETFVVMDDDEVLEDDEDDLVPTRT